MEARRIGPVLSSSAKNIARYNCQHSNLPSTTMPGPAYMVQGLCVGSWQHASCTSTANMHRRKLLLASTKRRTFERRSWPPQSYEEKVVQRQCCARKWRWNNLLRNNRNRNGSQGDGHMQPCQESTLVCEEHLRFNFNGNLARLRLRLTIYTLISTFSSENRRKPRSTFLRVTIGGWYDTFGKPQDTVDAEALNLPAAEGLEAVEGCLDTLLTISISLSCSIHGLTTNNETFGFHLMINRVEILHPWPCSSFDLFDPQSRKAWVQNSTKELSTTAFSLP